MSCDYNRPKCECGTRVPTTCVDYEGTIPECSTLTSNNLNAEEVFEDIYKLVCDIKSEIDVSDINTGCLPQKTTVKDMLTTLAEKVCELQQSINSAESFSDCNLDYKGLIDPCGNVPSISTQCEFNQFLIDKIAELWAQVN